MHDGETNDQPAGAVELGLAALGWTVSDAPRAHRLLDLTGLDPDDLRARAADPAILSAVFRFLESHEPDLLACADALGCDPAAMVAAHRELDAL